MLMQKQQQQQLSVAQSDSGGSADGVEEDVGLSGRERPNSSLPDLAVACVNACDSPSFLKSKAILLREKKSGDFARLKSLKPLSPITVPQRAIKGDFGASPSSGSPTPTDFSPMLLPKAEENLTALISEHNQQQRQLQIQQLQQQQFQLQVQQFQQQLQQQQLQQLQQQQLLQQVQQQQLLGPMHTLIAREPVLEQPSSKRPRLSTRGRKRHSETPAATEQKIGIGSLLDPLAVPQRRSSLASTAVSVNPEEASTEGSSTRKGPWLASEDERLLQLVEKYGAHDWSFIAEHIHGRVGKQCRERYFNHLAPDVRKEAWTDHEDEAIVHAHHVVGNKWTHIAKILGNGRSPNSIKNRWHSSLKNRLAEHGGESAVMEITGAATDCHCECKHCDCTCKVACVAFRCSCCFAIHHPNASEPAEDAQTTISASTDDESPRGGSASSTPKKK